MKLFSKKTGQLAIATSLPPTFQYLHIPDTTCYFATGAFGHFLLQEITLEAITIRYTDIIPTGKAAQDELLLIEENTLPVLHAALQGSQKYQLQDLGTVSFHERGFNLYIPPPVVTILIDHPRPVTQVQVFINWELTENLALNQPLLANLLFKRKKGKAVMLTRHHQIATWKMLDTLERLKQEKHISLRNDLVAYFLSAAFQIAAETPITKKGILTDEDRTMIYAIKERMLNSLDKNYTKEELLQEHPTLKKYKFEKGFHEVFGKSAFSLLTEQRMKLAADLLEDERRLTIMEIASETGYKDASPFVKAFYRFFGLYPETFRQHQKKREFFQIPLLSQ